MVHGSVQIGYILICHILAIQKYGEGYLVQNVLLKPKPNAETTIILQEGFALSLIIK